MSNFSLRAQWVLPMDAPPLREGVVSVAEGRIVSIGQTPASPTYLEDLGNVILMPGLVNAHTHLEFSDLEQPLGDAKMCLPDWIRRVISHRKRGNRDPAKSLAQGLVEYFSTGTTTIGEISTAGRHSYVAVAGGALVAFEEVIGFSAGRIQSILSEVEHRLAHDDPEMPECYSGISPHAPYTVHPDLFKRLVSLARQRKIPVAMHLAESREELELLATGTGLFRELLMERSMWDPDAIPRGSRPLDYLRVLAEAPRSLVIHGNYLNSSEIAFLAKHRERMALIYCPRTHAYFGHDPYPLCEMLSAGVQVALGTDSRASNPDLNLLGELRCLARQFPQLSPETILRLGTIQGATALGLGQDTGSLTPGKWADMIAVPCTADCEPYETLLHTEARPHNVWSRGRLHESAY